MLLRVDPFTPSQAMLKAAASMASMGQLVVFPTDTIYGIGTSSYSQAGVMRLFSCKKRSVNKPLGVFMSDFDQLHQHCIVSEGQASFLKTIWPGPITCVLSKQVKSQLLTTPQRIQPTTVAVRIPANAVACDLVRQLGHPLLQTSVNIAGMPHASYEDLLKLHERYADVMVDGGAESSNAPSTVINLSEKKASLVREGSTPWAQVADALEMAGLEAER